PLEEIFSELKIFARCFDPKSLARLMRIVHGGGARIPGHVPRGHVPKQNGARLERRNLAKQKQDAAPFRSFPRNMRLDKKRVRHERAKSAERRDEPELAELFPQIEVEIDRAEVQAAVRFGYPMFQRHARGGKKKDAEHDDRRAAHNSFRKKAVQARAR